MSGVLPNGPEWECGTCKRRYPEDYGPPWCECGGVLTRVLAVLKLRAQNEEAPAGTALNAYDVLDLWSPEDRARPYP